MEIMNTQAEVKILGHVQRRTIAERRKRKLECQNLVSFEIVKLSKMRIYKMEISSANFQSD